MTITEILESMDYGPAMEDATPAFDWLKVHDRRLGHFIDGAFPKTKGLLTFETVNPADGKVLADCVQGTQADVDAAVKAARAAQPGWAALKGTVRARYLYAIARHLQKHHRLLAVLETLDNGKTVRESRDIDIPLAVRHFYYHAGWAANYEEEFPGYQALGVCGQIIPWNFPLLMLAWKIAPALAMGNTVVLKPAEQTPLTASLFAQICQDVGLPAGVVNIVHGDGQTGAAIVEHEGVDKIAFTGSTEVGRKIRPATAGSGKELTLELGGKSPFIVFDDADIDSAVEGVVDSIWFNQGQVCCAGSRLLVQEGIADKFLQKLKARMANLRVGNPLDKCVDLGPIVCAAQHSRISALVTRAAADGAEVTKIPDAVPETGFFYPPTLINNVETSFEIVNEEVFGPVLVSLTFRTPDEAVALANNSRYGLAGSVWSENINLALGVAEKLEAGVVWVNAANQLDAAAEFGGVKESGFGREGGRDGLYAYLKQVPAPTAKKAKGLKHKITAPSEGLDRTAKMFIGGKQARPDSGYSQEVRGVDGSLLGHAGLGNRKDIRNAVEAAVANAAWTKMQGHGRAQVLYYLAENLAARRDEFANRIASFTGFKAEDEVDEAIDTLIRYAGWADKFDGAVRDVNAPGVVLKTNTPIGVIGAVCPAERPLSGLVDLVAPALAMGNRVVACPSEAMPLIATDFYQVLETSDLPAGALNIVTGKHDELLKPLAMHNGVGALWVAERDALKVAEDESIGNLKRTWCAEYPIQTQEALRQSTQSKSVWIPFGE